MVKKNKNNKNKKKGLQFGLKQKLVIYMCLIAIIPMLSIGITSILQSQNEVEQIWEENVFAIAKSKSHTISTWINARRGDCVFLSKTPTLYEFTGTLTDNVTTGDEDYALQEIQIIMQDMIDEYGCYDEILIQTTTGFIVAQANTEGWEHTHELNNTPTNIEGIVDCSLAVNQDDNGHTFLTDYRISNDGTYIQITVSSPIIDPEEEFVGVVTLYIDIDFISELMQDSSGLGNTGETYLVSHELTWMTESKFDYYTTQTEEYSEIFDTILHETITQTGAVEAKTINNGEIIKKKMRIIEG